VRQGTHIPHFSAAVEEALAAHELLAPLYGWVTEGFGALDLRGAKALLEVFDAWADHAFGAHRLVGSEGPELPLTGGAGVSGNISAVEG